MAYALSLAALAAALIAGRFAGKGGPWALTARRLRESLATARSLSREPGVQRLVADTLEGLLREAMAEQRITLPRLTLPGPFRRRSETGDDS